MVLPIKLNRLQDTMLETKSSGSFGTSNDLIEDIRNPEKSMFIHGYVCLFSF